MRDQHCAYLILSALALLGAGLLSCGSPQAATPAVTPVPKYPATISGAGSLSAPSTFVASATPSAGPTGFPSDIYPPPVAVAPGINVSNMTTGCPNVEGLEQASELPVIAMNDVFQSLASGDLDLMRRVVDRAYWPYLPDMGMGIGTPHPFSRDTLDTPRPASESPYADLVRNACGSKTLELSWWVRYCPGPCADPNVARSESLTGNYNLIRRRGHWLVWAAE